MIIFTDISLPLTEDGWTWLKRSSEWLKNTPYFKNRHLGTFLIFVLNLSKRLRDNVNICNREDHSDLETKKIKVVFILECQQPVLNAAGDISFCSRGGRIVKIHLFRCFTIPSTAPLLLISPALLYTLPRLGGGRCSSQCRWQDKKRKETVWRGNEWGGGRRMEGVIEREAKRPGREDKPCLPCLDISLPSLLGVNTPI